MKANLETVPKFRITLTRGPEGGLPPMLPALPEDLIAERQPDGSWHLWEDGGLSGITIPAEAVGPLVSILNGFDRYAPDPVAAPAKPTVEPDPGFRIVAPGDIIQAGDRWKFRGGDSHPVLDCVAGCPLAPLTSGIILQRPVAPEPTVEPDPGYRRVTSGEISRDGDLWKYPDGHTIPGTPGFIHCGGGGVILQRLDPDAVAPGHNPDKLTVAQVGIAEGWRLLTPAEVKEFRSKEVIPAEFWSTGWNSGCSWFVTSDSTLRTKAEKLEVVWSRS